MEDEIYKYFLEKYNKCRIKVVPGHWPDFKTREEVDKWIEKLETQLRFFEDYFEK